ncbi:MAG: DNA replication/repair protein RecF [Desulfotomaculales bacterium]
MLLERLALRNFRNYAELAVAFGPGLNVIAGGNAQGKTNLLEAIYWLLRAAPLRPVADRDLILWGETAARAEGSVRAAGGARTIAVAVGPDGKRIWAGGVPARRRELVESTGVVTFTPDDLWLVKGEPRERRRYLDREVAAFVPAYGDDLGRYRRALAQRNAALRAADRSAVEVWTEKVVTYGARLVSARLQFLASLVPVARELFARWDGAELNVRYRSVTPLGGSDPASLAEALRAALARNAARELELGQTLAGPHRDDLVLEVGGRPAGTAASQGQQRSLVLALKLAQVRLWRKQTGESPLMLLDDVFSELDAARRDRLLAVLDAGVQMFVTATQPPRLETDAAVYRVAGGRLVKEV